MFMIYIPSSPPSCLHFDAFGQFSFYSQKHFHGATFLLHAIPSQMPRSQRFLAMMNHSEPFLFFYFILCFALMYCDRHSCILILCFASILSRHYLLISSLLLRFLQFAQTKRNIYVFIFSYNYDDTNVQLYISRRGGWRDETSLLRWTLTLCLR